MLTKPTSFNGKLVLEAYVHTEIRSNTSKGWTGVVQKNNLKGLKVLVDADLPNGESVQAGSTAWIKEDFLYSQPWAKDIRKCDFIPGEFILVTMNEVEFVSPPKGDVA